VDAAVLQSMVEDMREREEELNRKYRLAKLFTRFRRSCHGFRNLN
jgi:hypothetical protein